jgi:hypothetical protein
MSVDYYMVCHECRQSLHVAQDGLSGWTFYRGEPDCMKALGAFLESHKFHPAQVSMAPEQYYEDYEEVDWQASPAPSPVQQGEVK